MGPHQKYHPHPKPVGLGMLFLMTQKRKKKKNSITKYSSFYCLMIFFVKTNPFHSYNHNNRIILTNFLKFRWIHEKVPTHFCIKKYPLILTLWKFCDFTAMTRFWRKNSVKLVFTKESFTLC